MSILDRASLRELERFVEQGMEEANALIRRRSDEPVESTPGRFEYTYTPDSALIGVSFKPAAPPRELVAADAVQAVTLYAVRLPKGTLIRSHDYIDIFHELAGIPSPLSMDVIGPYYKSMEISRLVMARLIEPGGA